MGARVGLDEPATGARTIHRASGRERLGDLLATRMAAYVAPPPPPGTTSWDYLAAVSCARRERDLARLHRDDSLRARLTARTR